MAKFKKEMFISKRNRKLKNQPSGILYLLNQNKVMKKIVDSHLWLYFLLFTVGINAQEIKPLIQSKLNGSVVDEITNEPIIGASINIKGTTHGVSSDLDGKFYFQTGQKLPYTLIISYVGSLVST